VRKLMNDKFAWAVSVGVGLFTFVGGSHAALITGNPATDPGWTSQGLSTASTNLVQQTTASGNYSATVYSTAFILNASSSLVNSLGSSSWNVGDTIVGIGGVFTSAATNSDLTYSGGADEHGVSHAGATSTRIVAKYGTSTATWTTPGDGSLLSGGVGSVLLGTFASDFYPANSGQLIVPADAPQEQTGPAAANITTISGDLGRVITSWTGTSSTDTMIGFESFLDLTQLNISDPSNRVALGDHLELDLQRSTNDFQDSLATLPSSVPEPTSFALILLGAAGVSFRRRKN
jgi:hypothetical protein